MDVTAAAGAPARPLAVLGGHVVADDHAVRPRDLLLIDGRIRTLPAGRRPPAGVETLDATGCVVAPGFIDTHVHGALGHNFMDATGLAAISGHLLRHGVTACLAATATTDPARQRSSLAALAAATGRLAPGGAELLGVHLEGPFLSPAHAGVHRRAHLRNPTPAEISGLLDAAAGRLRVVTLAPELPGGAEAVTQLAEAGVTVSLGHSGATDADVREAVRLGVTRATHLFNGMPPMHHREPGPVPALLTDPRVRVELVADGRHVADRMLQLAVAAAGPDRAMLVSDGADVSGLADGAYTRWEGTRVSLRGTHVSRAGGGVAGSGAGIDAGVRRLVHHCGVPAGEALHMASAVPAASLGLTDRGTTADGAVADLVVLDRLRVRHTLVSGALAYSEENHP
ncbi:N-acetylglucosamine-6-phosphate deacetylase [Streptomyces sp. MAR4 CNX-425]|uniref:N-acetylglucosamine-6-phosphate deacetylase n=1 Tax=Streptomyces sp. MAR4 CNX-425 TaxID=3406343 RepID=UPI003B50999E